MNNNSPVDSALKPSKNRSEQAELQGAAQRTTRKFMVSAEVNLQVMPEPHTWWIGEEQENAQRSRWAAQYVIRGFYGI